MSRLSAMAMLARWPRRRELTLERCGPSWLASMDRRGGGMGGSTRPLARSGSGAGATVPARHAAHQEAAKRPSWRDYAAAWPLPAPSIPAAAHR